MFLAESHKDSAFTTISYINTESEAGGSAHGGSLIIEVNIAMQSVYISECPG